MTTLVTSEHKLPAGGTTPERSKDWAAAQKALRDLHRQAPVGLEHLLAILEYRRDAAVEKSLSPTATEHQRGRAYEANELVKQVAAILTLTEN